MKGDKRRYIKFRGAPYYGGIATADAVGCSFLCAYCWSYNRNENPERFGKFYSAKEAAGILLEIARRRSFTQFRITGSEPVLGENSFNHLLKVIEIILDDSPRHTFILETNGFILGHKEDLVKRLKLPRLLVRVAVKGIDPESFEKITGAGKEYFKVPLLAIKNLERMGIQAWPALMEDLFSEDQVEDFIRTLKDYGISSDLELERLERYPFVLNNLRRRGIYL
ncbi:MAG: radical SAM protein [Candidatus Aminicenantes bacterium]|nr:radical SAM protein [Candidatus Aminicenantes bacterium]